MSETTKKQHIASTKNVTVEKVVVKPEAPNAPDDGPPPLNAELLASYRDSHHRLLLLLGLFLAFVLSCFPISDPDIFFSLQVGKMVSAGEFPWGEDPFCFAAGDKAPWVHPGWLGDTIIYSLYKAGGGPLLVLIRAVLVVFLFWLMMKLGGDRSPGLGMVVTLLLGIVALSQRLYFRTELFSFVLLGITFWVLTRPPCEGCWLSRLHRLTANRWYWLLPILFLFWVNLDNWFFLGLLVPIIWCAFAWMKPAEFTKQQLHALTIATLLSVVACCCSPFHIKSFTDIPVQLLPPTATELHARFLEQKQNNAKQRYAEQQRAFESPWTGDFIVTQRGESILSMMSQAPLLPLCYPSGLSISEWMYYPLTFLVLLSIFFAREQLSWGKIALIVFFLVLSAWQSRFIGFFAVVGTALAILQFQSLPVRPPSLARLNILGGQLLCLLIGLFTQVLCLLHLIPTPDFSPSSLGHVHPRGPLGFSFRYDRAIQEACQQLGRDRDAHRLAGKPFHFDWTDVVAYDSWFNPGGRHFFDRRSEVHDETVTHAFITAQDALLNVALEPLKDDRSNIAKVLERQARWQEVFNKYDIGYLVVKKRTLQADEVLVRNLLRERDKDNQPVWRVLQLHNGQMYALGWTGSKHWDKLRKLEFSPDNSVFRREKQFSEIQATPLEKLSISSYLLGDAPRRPPSLDESSWHLLYPAVDSYDRLLTQITYLELHTLAVNLAARYATPMNGLLYIPKLLSHRQNSVASMLLALESARRGIAELAPDAVPAQRLDAWLRYLQSVTQLIDYEQMFTSTTVAYHEPLRLYVMRQAAIASLDAGYALDTNLQLARMYITAGAYDAALEHFTFVRQFVEKQQSDKLEENLKNLETLCQKQFGFSPTDLQNEVTRLTESWQREVARAGWQPAPNDPGKDVINRAGLAIRMGLPRLALDELHASDVKTIEVSVLACQVYTILGRHDIVLEKFLEPSPAIRTALGPVEFHFRASLGEWCLGRPDRAAEHRQAIAQLMDQNSRQSILDASMRSLFGTNTQPIGNVLAGTMIGQQAAAESFGIADQLVAAGLLSLEAGKPRRAAELFYQAMHDVEPATPWRPLLERYYEQITGRMMPK